MVFKVKYCCSSVYLLEKMAFNSQIGKKERKSKAHVILNNDNKRKENVFIFSHHKCPALFLHDKIYQESI